MKILMINTVPTEKNGITNVIRNLCTAMDRENLQLDWMAIHVPEAEYVRAVERWGGCLRTVARSIRHPLRYLKALTRVIREEGYDAVHIHGNSATLVLELIAAKLAGCKLRIVHSHNTSCLHKTLNNLLQPAFQRLCTHRLACSEAAGTWLYGKRPFTVIQNGVDTGRFSFDADARRCVRASYGIPEDAIVVGHVGLFTKTKNQRFLLEILNRLPDQYCLMLVGDGPDAPEVRNQANAMGLTDRVFFAGAVTEPEQYYSAFDMMALPSLFEGLPLTLVEAQSSGLHCLVSDRVTREADLTGNLAFLPIDQGADIWREAIQRMKITDREVCGAMARERICHAGFDIRQEAAKLREYYLAAAGKE